MIGSDIVCIQSLNIHVYHLPEKHREIVSGPSEEGGAGLRGDMKQTPMYRANIKERACRCTVGEHKKCRCRDLAARDSSTQQLMGWTFVDDM